MRAAIIIPDGVGLRNFVLTDFLTLVARRGPTLVLHCLPEPLAQYYARASGSDAKWKLLPPYGEKPAAALLRYSLEYSQMYWADTRSMRATRAAGKGGSRRARTLYRSARLIGRMTSSPARIRALGRMHSEIVKRHPDFGHYRRLLRSSGASVLFCSHQRPPRVGPAVLAAKSLGIPTATFIFSWDNLTSKGRIAAPFDHYLVWSEHMADELRRYYPDVSRDRIHVVGTPQFDLYCNEAFAGDRTEFFTRIGADPSHPLICFSGGDTRTSPEDPDHVRILMDLIRADRIKGRPQVVLRPAPVDDGRRYEPVAAAYPELIYAPPGWIRTGGDWSDVVPRIEDIEFLASLTKHADLNINMASTMTLDFAIHDVPVVNTAFDVSQPGPFGLPLWEHFYEFEHYRPVVELGAARFARSPEELATHVNDYLVRPDLDREGRRRLVDIELGNHRGPSAPRVVAALEEIAGLKKVSRMEPASIPSGAL
jgi:hypothetical protein